MRVHAAGAAVALFVILGTTLLYAAGAQGEAGAKQNGTTGTAPTIDVWYGNYQRFGELGTPQRRVNILGSVSHPVGISALRYKLNGGAYRSLSFLPDDRRLTLIGDFNADIELKDLGYGQNTMVITAVASTGDSAQSTVTVERVGGQVWPLPYRTAWTQLADSAQVVDGKWALMDGGARILEAGYDRMLAIGDTTWSDYEVTAKLTVWGIDSSFAAWDQNNGGPGVGFLMRWKGHTNKPTLSITQPLTGYLPCGAIGWYHWGKSGWTPGGVNRWEIDAPSSGDLYMQTSDMSNPIYYGIPYYIKMQVKTIVGTGSQYKVKVWPVGSAEPANWLLTYTQPTGQSDALSNGSLILLAHHVYATYGTINVTPTPDGVPPVISNIAASTTSTTATITWTTDEAASSSVAYGLTTSYTNATSDLENLVTGHSILLENLQPNTIYHYVVTSADFGGASSTSTDRTFQTAVLTVPSAPVIVSPGNGSSGIPTITTLVWRRSATATGYRVQLGTDATFTSGVAVDDASLTDTLRAVSGLLPGTRYYWRVNARNSSGEGPFTGIATFVTGLDVPVLTSPSNGAANVSPTPRFSWRPVPFATSYRVRVSTDSTLTGTTVFDDSTIVDTTRVGSALTYGQKYYWRVRAKNTDQTGAFSSAWWFTAGVAAPTLVSPANGSTNVSVNTTLKWTTVPFATSYDVQLGTNAAFTSGVVVFDSLKTDTTRAVSGLSPGTVYYWRVRARSALGAGEFGATWSFTTGLAVAQLVSPANNSTGQPVSLAFLWRRVSNATAYAFQLGTDPTFATGLVKNDTSVADTTRFVAGLAYKTTYYWHVRARQGAATGPFSETWNFTTTARLPDAVTLIQLADGASGIGQNNVRFIWNHSQPGVTRYWFEMALDPNFSLRSVDSSIVDSTTVVNSLITGSDYYWRVRAGNVDGWGPFSQTRSFHVGTSAVEPEQGLPKILALEQNYPNPFNPSTRIRFALPAEKKVRLEIYTVLGDRVATLVDDRLSAGIYNIQVDGSRMASGVYYYRLVTPESCITRKMLLVK
jgi:hypothetical protein